MALSKDPIDFLIYLILFGSALFVNKYVLSVLRFTYPTIFQGWQTLVGGALLRLMLSYKCLSVSPTALDKSGFISLLPSFLFFSAGVVASSKALALLSVPVFLCIYNSLSATLYLLEVAPSFRGGSGPVALVAAVAIVITTVVVIITDHQITQFSDSPYFWMLVYLLCMGVQTLHSKIADARYTEVDRLYFSYIFSVIVLAPASVYLEEAFQVLHFPNASRYDFYIGCLLSGILGLFLSLSLMKVRRHKLFSVVDAAAKLITSLFSFAIFKDHISVLAKILISCNLLAAVFVPVPLPATSESSGEHEEKLLTTVQEEEEV